MNVIIIGGGASGLITSIILARKGYNVTILEKNNKCGKKLLITGNGRCNYFNDDFSIEHYRSNNLDILKQYITDDYKNKILSFFDGIGVIPKIKDGYYYPYSNTSYSILNALLVEINKLGVNIIYNEEVIDIKEHLVITANNKYKADKTIICTGSYAAPKTGSDGMGYKILKKIGHSITDIKPALVQLKGDESYFSDWAGIRCDAKVSLYEDNKYITSYKGEVQLTNYGISGICVMNLSGRVALNLDKHKEEISINFMPVNDVYSFLEEQNNKLSNRSIIELLESIINYKLLYVILKKCKIKDNYSWNDLEKNQKTLLVKNLTDFRLKITGTKDYNDAQVVTGGIPLFEVTNNFESLKMKDLYIAGELLDVDGDCGGYNLGFAWVSGIIIGENM